MFVKLAALGGTFGSELFSVLVVNQLDPHRRLDTPPNLADGVSSHTSGRAAQPDAYIPAWSLESQSRQAVAPATMLPPTPMTFLATAPRKSARRVVWACVFVGVCAAIVAVGLGLS